MNLCILVLGVKRFSRTPCGAAVAPTGSVSAVPCSQRRHVPPWHCVGAAEQRSDGESHQPWGLACKFTFDLMNKTQHAIVCSTAEPDSPPVSWRFKLAALPVMWRRGIQIVQFLIDLFLLPSLFTSSSSVAGRGVQEPRPLCSGSHGLQAESAASLTARHAPQPGGKPPPTGAACPRALHGERPNGQPIRGEIENLRKRVLFF